jgi:hypothetical protein
MYVANDDVCMMMYYYIKVQMMINLFFDAGERFLKMGVDVY